MADQESNTTASKFRNLPEEIREWATSDFTAMAIAEINNRLGFKSEKRRIIPRLILMTLTQELEPRDFINQLSQELGVTFQTAKSITEDIDRSVLKTIENTLRKDLSIDIKLFYFGKPTTQNIPDTKTIPVNQAIPEIKKSAPIPEDTRPIVDLQSFKIKGAAGQVPSVTANMGQAPKLAFAPTIKSVAPSSQSRPQSITEEAPMVPFILHQESPTSAPTLSQSISTGSSPAMSGSSLPKTSLTMKVQNYFQSAGTSERTAPAPISIKVEAPAAQQAIIRSEQKIAIARQPAPPIPKPEASPMSTSMLSTASATAPQTNQAGSVPSASSLAGQAGQVRVVNYSSLRTPLNTVGLPKKEPDKNNVVDLRKF